VHSFTIARKHDVAVFHRGGSFPNFEALGHSYFILIGIAYVWKTTSAPVNALYAERKLSTYRENTFQSAIDVDVHM